MNKNYRVIWNTKTNNYVATYKISIDLAKILNNAKLKSTIASSMLSLTLSFFGTANGAVINTGETKNVNNNETVTAVEIKSGGRQNINSGGVANETAINGGTQNINNGGTAYQTTISNAGTQNVYVGGISSGVTIDMGTQSISGGTVNNAILNNFSEQHLYSGATTNGTVINDASIQWLYSMATANGTTINNDGFQYINNGSIANNTTINSGLQNIDSEGVANSTIINGGDQSIQNGGLANNTTIEGGSQSIENGGIANSTTINGGKQFVLGTTNNTIINNGGIQDVDNAGVAKDTTINSGGQQKVHNGGNDKNTVINGGEQYIDYGGISDATTINTGSQNIFLGGTANNATINSSGIQEVNIGGMANNTTINTGGLQNINNGGTASTTSINGGIQNIFLGGIANDISINNGMQNINGIANNIIINGGTQSIFSGGIANNTTINSGTQTVSVNGLTNNTTMNNGIQNISGTSNNSTINGGVQSILSGGIASNTTINGGVQSIKNGGIAQNTVVNSGTLRLDAGEITRGTVEESGIAQITDNGGTISEYLIIKGSLGGESANSQLTVNQNANLVFNQNIDSSINLIISGDGSLIKENSNTLTINSSNTYTGLTTINGGTLLIGGNGSQSNASITSDVLISNGGILGGHGQINGSVVVSSGGSILPGSSIGILTVGSAHFEAGSNLTIETHANHNDLLIAKSSLGSGTVTIDNNSTLFINAVGGGWSAEQDYTIVSSTNGVNGEFSTVDTELIFLDYNIVYDTNNIMMKLFRNNIDFSSVADTVNQYNTANGVESLPHTNAIYGEIVGMNATKARHAFDILSGEIHASARAAMLNNAQFSRNAIYNHLKDTSTALLENQRELWIDLWGQSGDLKKYKLGAASMKNKGFGFLVGSDIISTENTRFGAAIGYEENDLKVNERASKADTKAMHLMLYGQSSFKSFDLSGGFGYSIQDIDVKRDVLVGSLYSHNTAKYSANVFQLFLKGKYNIELTESATIAPYVSLAYQNLKTKSKTEKGAITNLTVQGKSDNLLTTYLGIESRFKLNNEDHLYADVAWKNNSKESYYSMMRFSEGEQFKIHGAALGKNSTVINVGGEFNLTSGSKFNVGYEGEFSGKARNNSLKLQYQYRF